MLEKSTANHNYRAVHCKLLALAALLDPSFQFAVSRLHKSQAIWWRALRYDAFKGSPNKASACVHNVWHRCGCSVYRQHNIASHSRSPRMTTEGSTLGSVTWICKHATRRGQGYSRERGRSWAKVFDNKISCILNSLLWSGEQALKIIILQKPVLLRRHKTALLRRNELYSSISVRPLYGTSFLHNFPKILCRML